MTMHRGSCHCGDVAFEVEGDPAQVIECNCSHCDRKGYLLWFVPRAQVRLTAGAENMGSYLFNRHVIRHHFCKRCGCAPFGAGKDGKGNETMAINVRCLPQLDRSKLKIMPYDGRSK
jgi:hypothetical protein